MYVLCALPLCLARTGPAKSRPVNAKGAASSTLSCGSGVTGSVAPRYFFFGNSGNGPRPSLLPVGLEQSGLSRTKELVS